MPVEGDLQTTNSSRRAGRAVALAIGAFVIAVASFAAGWLSGGRRTVLAVSSPSRAAIAFVMEARCAQWRCQSLRISANAAGTRARTVETLSGDERADEIAWTPDGGRVAFLVNGYQLRVFDAHTGTNLGAASLLDPDGSPPSRIARGVTFSSNGAAVTFDDCPREHSGCRPGLVALKLR